MAGHHSFWKRKKIMNRYLIIISILFLANIVLALLVCLLQQFSIRFIFGACPIDSPPPPERFLDLPHTIMVNSNMVLVWWEFVEVELAPLVIM